MHVEDEGKVGEVRAGALRVAGVVANLWLNEEIEDFDSKHCQKHNEPWG